MFRLEKIFIDEMVGKSMVVERALRYAEEVGANVIYIKGDRIKDYFFDFMDGKRILYIANNKGKMVKKCPCSRGVINCGYYVIEWMLNCPMMCSYCYLQAYLDVPYLMIYANQDKILEELDRLRVRLYRFPLRIGTGEYSDSIAFSEISGINELLIDFFSKANNWLLEIKSKTYIKLDREFPRNYIFSFSLNDIDVARKEELKAISLYDRLYNAREIVEAGYLVSFHFDPIIMHISDNIDEAIERYLFIVDEIFRIVPKEAVIWMSLGGMRFMPRQKYIAYRNHKNSMVYSFIFKKERDGKYRYDKYIRIRFYKALYERIKRYNKHTFVYLCMEFMDVYKEVFGDGRYHKRMWFMNMFYEAYRKAMGV